MGIPPDELQRSSSLDEKKKGEQAVTYSNIGKFDEHSFAGNHCAAVKGNSCWAGWKPTPVNSETNRGPPGEVINSRAQTGPKARNPRSL